MGETINSNCNNTIKGVCVTGGSNFMSVTTSKHVDNNSGTAFADELAQINRILPTHDDLDRLRQAMTELESALRKNDQKTFGEGVRKYSKALSIPFFARMASEPFINIIKNITPHI